MLNLNLKDASEAVYYNKLSKEVMDYLHAYSDGVNYFLEHEKETYRYAFLALPLEFTLVGHEPEPWKAADTMATLKLMCYIGNTILRYTTTLHPKYNNPQLTHMLIGLAQLQGDVEKFIIQMIKGGVDIQKLKYLFSPHLYNLDEALLNLIKKVIFSYLLFLVEAYIFLP